MEKQNNNSNNINISPNNNNKHNKYDDYLDESIEERDQSQIPKENKETNPNQQSESYQKEKDKKIKEELDESFNNDVSMKSNTQYPKSQSFSPPPKVDIYHSSSLLSYYDRPLKKNKCSMLTKSFPYKPLFFPNPHKLYEREAEYISHRISDYKSIVKKEEKINIANRGRQIVIDKTKLLLSKPEQINHKIKVLSNQYLNMLNTKGNPFSINWTKRVLKNTYKADIQIKKFYNCLPQYIAPPLKNKLVPSSSLRYMIKSNSCSNYGSRGGSRIEFPSILKYFDEEKKIKKIKN